VISLFGDNIYFGPFILGTPRIGKALINEKYHNYMKTVSLGLVSVLSTGLGLFLLSIIQVSAQPLVMNTPTGSMTDGANISINPEEPLPSNGTVSISTEGAADTDVIPPEGVTVVIENDTVTVTNQTVDIETAEDDTGDGDTGDGDTGDGDTGDGDTGDGDTGDGDTGDGDTGDGDTGEEDSPEEGE
jgi:hypothetical protein